MEEPITLSINASAYKIIFGPLQLDLALQTVTLLLHLEFPYKTHLFVNVYLTHIGIQSLYCAIYLVHKFLMLSIKIVLHYVIVKMVSHGIKHNSSV